MNNSIAANSESLIEDFKAKDKSNPSAANRLLFSWLSDDRQRQALYSEMVVGETILEFESRALADEKDDNYDEDRPKSYRQKAYLVVHPDHVDQAYHQASLVEVGKEEWSHTPYNKLGGTFMLALDEQTNQSKGPFQSHDAQRTYCFDLLNKLTPSLDAVATIAFKSGAMLALKNREFDVADLAEMVAVNYVARLFGFSQADLPLLKQTAQKIGNGLMHVNVGRHFITDAIVIPNAKQSLAALSQRAADLIDLYDFRIGKDQEDQWKNLEEELENLRKYKFFDSRPSEKLAGFEPMMQTMAKTPSKFSTTEKAIMVAGLVSGTITNMRAAVCIAIKQFFSLNAENLQDVKKKAVDARLEHKEASWSGPKAETFRALVEEALRANPPPPFVPRRAAVDIDLGKGNKIPKDSLIIIAVGGGSWDESVKCTKGNGYTRFNLDAKLSDPQKGECPFNKVFGGAPELSVTNAQRKERAEYLHSCIGKDLAMYSISYTVRQLMVLPGLTQALDDRTGTPFGLTKKAGFICERYPLEYEREKLLRQSPLQTVLPVKNPVPEHAAALRQVLQFGAPFIEKVLRDARHVHFASFMFIDNDSKLVLFTSYDGDFDSYIGHFAREFGPLFDRFFSHIENGPKAPIAEHPFEFVQFLRRYDQPAVGGLFFSAYPEVQVDQITHQFSKDRKFDLFTYEGGK
jgi:cytochrome P450